MLEIIPWASTLMIGLFTGSLLSEAIIMVPYWRKMKPTDFFRLHGTLGPNLFRFFAPLTTLAVGLGIANAIIDQGQHLAWMLTAILCAITLAIFFLYFRKANASFADHSLTEDALEGELRRWAFWNWTRTTLMLAAFGLSISGHM